MREWERREERGERNHAGSGSGLRPAAIVPRESSISTHTHTHTHTPPAAAHLLDCWHRQPPAHAHLLIWIAQKRRKASTAYWHLFFLLGNCPDVVTVVTLKCLTCKVLIHQPLRCCIWLFLWTSKVQFNLQFINVWCLWNGFRHEAQL